MLLNWARYKKVKKPTYIIICLISILLSGCNTKSEIEKNWNKNGGFSQIYQYKGTGEILTMDWNNEKGVVFLQGINAKEAEEYVNLYINDPKYIEVGVSGILVGEARRFKKSDGSLGVIITIKNTSMRIDVELY